MLEYLGPSYQLATRKPSNLLELQGPSKTLECPGPSCQLVTREPSNLLERQGPSTTLECPGPSCQLVTREPSNLLELQGPSKTLECPGPSCQLATRKPSNLPELQGPSFKEEPSQLLEQGQPHLKRARQEARTYSAWLLVANEELAIRQPRQKCEPEEQEHGLAGPTISEQSGAQWPRITCGPRSPDRVHQRLASRSVCQGASSRESVLPQGELPAEPAAARELAPHEPAERAHREQQQILKARCFREGAQ
jgi:hypothetical protein